MGQTIGGKGERVVGGGDTAQLHPTLPFSCVTHHAFYSLARRAVV